MSISAKRRSSLVPNSHVRAPGILLSNKKDLLDNQASQYTSTGASHSDADEDSYEDFNILEDEEINSVDSFFQGTSFDNEASPGKLKSSSDNLSEVIQITKKTLSKHGIALNFDLPTQSFKDSSNILKILNCEVSIFPAGFFEKLGLDELIICYGNGPAFLEDISLQVDVLDTESKISGRLYRIILEHILASQPTIIKQWEKKSDTRSLRRSDSSLDSWNFEDVFIALMKGLNHTSLKQPAKNMREVLIKHFPEYLSEEWFQLRDITKKKMRRISFIVSQTPVSC